MGFSLSFSFFLPFFPFFSFFVFFFSFFDDHNEPWICMYCSLCSIIVIMLFNAPVVPKTSEHFFLSGTRCPRPILFCSCPRPRTSQSPRKPWVLGMGMGFRTQDLALRVFTATEVIHYIVQKKDLTPGSGWGSAWSPRHLWQNGD